MSSSHISPEQLAGWVRDARTRTLEIVDDLTDEQLRVPRLETLNPFLWEVGHIAWFQESWVLRHAAGADPLLSRGDALYDSTAVHHDTRWDLALPKREQTLHYVRAVRDRVLSRLDEAELGESEIYFNQLSVFHEDMHDEAFLYMRQTLGYSLPQLSDCSFDPGRPGDDAPGGGGRRRAGWHSRAGRLPRRVFRLRQRAVGPRCHDRAVCDRPDARDSGSVCRVRRRRRIPTARAVEQRRMALARRRRCQTPDPFRSRRHRLAATSLRSAASAGAPPAGDSRQRARSRGLLPLGRPAPTH